MEHTGTELDIMADRQRDEIDSLVSDLACTSAAHEWETFDRVLDDLTAARDRLTHYLVGDAIPYEYERYTARQVANLADCTALNCESEEVWVWYLNVPLRLRHADSETFEVTLTLTSTWRRIRLTVSPGDHLWVYDTSTPF